MTLFVLSAASLGFEVSLTRLFSYLFIQSYVYILISLSVAGIGFGAVLTYYIYGKSRARLSSLVAPLPPFLVLLLFFINSYHTLLIPSLILSFLIFFAVGIFQVLIFQESGIRPAYLYAADLCGAALGSLFSFLLLNLGGAPNSLSISSLLLAVAGIVIYLSYYRRRRIAVGLLLLTTVAAGIGLFAGFESKLLPNKDWQKEMTVMLESENRIAQIVETRWTAFGRVDLVKTENPLFRTMFIDGAAGTKMIEMKGGRVQESLARNLLFK